MKHIFIGIDGTWRAAFQDRFYTNVYRLNMSLSYRDKKDNPQLFIYGAGVGAGALPLRLIGGAFGEGLDEVILGSYINLVSNYEPGDKIYLFGFSRGAVAARALAGLISTSGLVRAESSPLIESAWKYFLDRDFNWNEISRVTHNDVEIEFIGVWDTVSGRNPNRASEADLFNRLRFRSLDFPRHVKHGIHLLAADETRRRFRPVLWTKCTEERQRLEQIWMPGVHSDVGGGYKKPLLSTISLLTMIDKMQERCPNIKFEEQYIKDVLLKIIIEEDVAVHNEFRDWKFITDLGYQRMAEKKHTNQFSHPLLSKLSGLEIDFKETRSRYSPCLLLQKGLSLPEIKFASGSHHGGKSMTDFFKRLEHSRPSGSAPGPISADSTNSKQELVHVACQGLET